MSGEVKQLDSILFRLWQLREIGELPNDVLAEKVSELEEKVSQAEGKQA